ncbi:protein lysine methyltransferase SET6 [Apiospora arundinis]
MAAPSSPPFIVHPHPLKGRAVTATRDLPPASPLLTTRPCSVYTIQREFRREVCARCFAYDRGVEWKVRVELPAEGKQKQSPTLGLVFCTEVCRDEWVYRQGTIGLQAWKTAWEIGSRQQGKRSSSSGSVESSDDGTNHDADGRPSFGEIDRAWAEAEDTLGKRVRELRLRESTEGAQLTKSERKLLQRAKDSKPPSIETLWAVVSGILTHYWTHNMPVAVLDEKSELPTEEDEWTEILRLKHHHTPFSSHEELQDYISAYLCLLTQLPVVLIPSLVPEVIQTLQNAAAHNSFSIRPALNSGAYNAEYLGWGLWTTGSIWNHSCAPNIAKARVRDRWVFVVDPNANGGAGVRIGEELCISYLGGDEKELTVTERRKRLQDAWGFECQCDACVREASL